MILDHELVAAVVLMDAGIPHTLMEYLILFLFGGGGEIPVLAPHYAVVQSLV